MLRRGLVRNLVSCLISLRFDCEEVLMSVAGGLRDFTVEDLDGNMINFSQQITGWTPTEQTIRT